MIHKDPNKILFVIVLYKCKLESSITYNTLLKDNVTPDDIFVYDNSPQKNYTDIKVGKYISDTSNGGLSIAYNTAAAYAKENSYKWLMLLDQDTNFPKGALGEYKDAIKENTNINMFVPKHKIVNGMYISPTKYKHFVSCEQEKVPDGVVRFKDVSPINSGMLIDLASFIKSGGYDENVYLDFSDISFIKKYQKNYHYFYILNDVVCLQHFSGTENDKGKVLNRFKIWIDCAFSLKSDSLSDKVALYVYVFRRLLYYIRIYRDLSFLKVFIGKLVKLL